MGMISDYWLGNEQEIPRVIREYAPLDDKTASQYYNWDKLPENKQYFADPSFGETKGASIQTIASGMFGKVSENKYIDVLATTLQIPVVAASELFYQLGTDGIEGRFGKAFADTIEQTVGYTGSRWRGDEIKTAEDAWESGRKTDEDVKKYYTHPLNRAGAWLYDVTHTR